MAPKNAATGFESLDAASVQFLLSTIGACDTFAPSWTAVAQQNGIKYAKNARPRFNAIVAKLGYKLEGDKVIRLNQNGNNQDAPPAQPPKTAKSKKLVTQKRNVEEKAEEEPEDDSYIKEESSEE